MDLKISGFQIQAESKIYQEGQNFLDLRSKQSNQRHLSSFLGSCSKLNGNYLEVQDEIKERNFTVSIHPGVLPEG